MFVYVSSSKNSHELERERLCNRQQATYTAPATLSAYEDEAG
jgi:hypothetical protein